MTEVRKSWLGRILPYVGFIEDELARMRTEIERLRGERDTAVNRLIQEFSGWGLDQKKPTVDELEKRQEEAAKAVESQARSASSVDEMYRMEVESAAREKDRVAEAIKKAQEEHAERAATTN